VPEKARLPVFNHCCHSSDHDGDIAKQQSGERQASYGKTVSLAEELIRFWPIPAHPCRPSMTET
jgi:hypothetical protein